MFWSIIGLLIVVVIIGLEVLRYIGLQVIKHSPVSESHPNEFDDNNFTGNMGGLSEAIENAVILLEDKQYLTFLKSYIPEEGKLMYQNDEWPLGMFLNFFEGKQSEDLLSALKMCQTLNIKMSNMGRKGECVLHGNGSGRNTIIFLKQKGSWRIEN